MIFDRLCVFFRTCFTFWTIFARFIGGFRILLVSSKEALLLILILKQQSFTNLNAALFLSDFGTNPELRRLKHKTFFIMIWAKPNDYPTLSAMSLIVHQRSSRTKSLSFRRWPLSSRARFFFSAFSDRFKIVPVINICTIVWSRKAFRNIFNVSAKEYSFSK